LTRPLLKNRLNIIAPELESGNAAPLYAAAHAELRNRMSRATNQIYTREDYAKAQWPEHFNEDGKKPAKDDNAVGKLKFKAFPIPQMFSTECHTEITPMDEEAVYGQLREVYKLLEKASKKRDSDWGYFLEFKGIATTLEHVQEMRELARYLSSKANWEIRNGKYDDAIKTLRIGFQLAKHLKESDFPVLVTVFVGIAFDGMMQEQLRLLISQPDAPNLYPALTQMVHRQDLLQNCLQAEMMLMFPQKIRMEMCDNPDAAAPEELKLLLDGVFEILTYFNVSEDRKDLAIPAILVACYPYAKERLQKKGFTDDEIDKLSSYQVVAPYIMEEIRTAYDQMIVASTFPRDTKHSAIEFAYDDYIAGANNTPMKVYFALMLPAVDAARNAFTRIEMTHDLMQITEAIRYYAFVHGKLPEKLEDITELHIPLMNKQDGKPFAYRTEGDTAFIEFNSPSYGGKSCWEITITPLPR
ncbi:MAG: hypothetical protein ACRC2T_12315, partial [Thermoguttaceae bacterium]